MGLSTQIQILCHHVLANEIALNLKYCIGLKQFFNINLGIGIIKKTTFFIQFSTYLLMFLLKYWLGELIGCEIKLLIQQVPARDTFHGPCYPKNKKYLEKHDPIEICVKTQGDMSKIQWQKSSFFYDTYPQIYIKKVFKTFTVFQIKINFIG